MQIEYIPIKQIKPYKANAKKHPPEQVEHIANSIREFGWQQPLVIDKDGVVVIGHGRLLAAKKLGMKEVPCVRAEGLTDEQIKALRLADNKTNESAWDQKLLAEDMGGIFDIDMSQFGFLNKSQDEEENEEPEVEFTEELMLTHNYIVLYFDNDFDWEVAQEKFGLKKVKDLIPRKNQPVGIGRVVNGKDVLKWQN
jgi:site-specific DNA-methyltransferase (adenine-specific)